MMKKEKGQDNNKSPTVLVPQIIKSELSCQPTGIFKETNTLADRKREKNKETWNDNIGK